MISIHSAEENKFAIDLANKENTRGGGVRIGAKRNNSLHNFEWISGQKFNYSNWASGEPKNSTNPITNVIMYNDSTWAAFDKEFRRVFMCETNLSDE